MLLATTENSKAVAATIHFKDDDDSNKEQLFLFSWITELRAIIRGI